MDGPFDELDWACSAVRNVTVTGSPPLLMSEPTMTPAAPLAADTRTSPRAWTSPMLTSIPSAGWYSTVVCAGDCVEHAARAPAAPTRTAARVAVERRPGRRGRDVRGLTRSVMVAGRGTGVSLAAGCGTARSDMTPSVHRRSGTARVARRPRVCQEVNHRPSAARKPLTCANEGCRVVSGPAPVVFWSSRKGKTAHGFQGRRNGRVPPPRGRIDRRHSDPHDQGRGQALSHPQGRPRRSDHPGPRREL